MNHLPQIISRTDLRYHWAYRKDSGEPFAIVARYNKQGAKKRFHQFSLDETEGWVEGAPTPLPLFGLDSLPKTHCEGSACIFEGERCTQAAHYLDLPAVTSMMGSSQAHLADWAVLAKYRHIKTFALFPDNDDASKKYMQAVYNEIKKSCPHSSVTVCDMALPNKGDDFVDWILAHPSCPPGWDGFVPIDSPYCDYLKAATHELIAKRALAAEDYFSRESLCPVTFTKDPSPIEETLSKVLPSPVQTLPASVANWLQDIADQMQIPVDFVAVPFIVFTGSLIGRKRALELRPNTGWIEFPNLWGMCIGRPSVIKSPAMEAAFKPLKALATKALDTFNNSYAEYEAQKSFWQIRKKAKDESYKKNFKDSLSSSMNATIEFDLEEEPQRPIRKRYKTDDSTVEKLGELLTENPHGMLLLRDELSGWLHSLNKPGREGDRQFFLEGWSGKKDYDIDRIKRGSLHIPALFISIFGGIQPGPLSQYVRSTLQGGAGDDGFLQRFQLMVWPDVKPDWELVENLPLKVNEATVVQLYEWIDRLTFDSEGKPVVLPFCDDAQEAFDHWQKILELRLRKGSLPWHLEAHFAKYKKLLPALCLIHEHLDAAATDTQAHEISLKSFTNAVRWIEYLESHAYRIYGSSTNAILNAAEELLKHIRKGDLEQPFSVRNVYHGHHWSGLATPDQVEEVLSYLVEKGYVASAVVKSGGRSSQQYWAHPKVFEN